MRKHIIIGLSLSLAGCQGSMPWYKEHPERKNIIIDGREFLVVPTPKGKNSYMVWENIFAEWRPDMLEKKQMQIKAAEKVTGCKVTDSERPEGTAMLQVLVSCNSN